MSQERSLVALTQFTATSDPERNFGVIRDLVEQAKACRAEVKRNEPVVKATRTRFRFL